MSKQWLGMSISVVDILCKADLEVRSLFQRIVKQMRDLISIIKGLGRWFTFPIH
jgi:hypothetical protein